MTNDGKQVKGSFATNDNVTRSYYHGAAEDKLVSTSFRSMGILQWSSNLWLLFSLKINNFLYIQVICLPEKVV